MLGCYDSDLTQEIDVFSKICSHIDPLVSSTYTLRYHSQT